MNSQIIPCLALPFLVAKARPGTSITFFFSPLSINMSQVSPIPNALSQRKSPPSGTFHSHKPKMVDENTVQNFWMWQVKKHYHSGVCLLLQPSCLFCSCKIFRFYSHDLEIHQYPRYEEAPLQELVKETRLVKLKPVRILYHYAIISSVNDKKSNLHVEIYSFD